MAQHPVPANYALYFKTIRCWSNRRQPQRSRSPFASSTATDSPPQNIVMTQRSDGCPEGSENSGQISKKNSWAGETSFSNSLRNARKTTPPKCVSPTLCPSGCTVDSASGRQWLLRKGADPIQQLDKFTLPGQGQDLHLMIPLWVISHRMVLSETFSSLVAKWLAG